MTPRHHQSPLSLLTLLAVMIAMPPANAMEYANWPDIEGNSSELLDYADAVELSPTEMATLRGGFRDPSGMLYNFSVNIETMLNGMRLFSRSISVDGAGANGQMQASATTQIQQQNIPSDLNLKIANNGSGLLLNDTNGTTTVLSQTSGGAPASIVINTADNRNISQSVNVSLTLNSLSAALGLSRTTGLGSAMAQHNTMRSLGL